MMHIQPIFNMSGKIQYSKACLILLGIVCAGALFARMEGIKWPKLHPDEHVIGAWTEQSAYSIYTKDRVYPNGFVTLARPFVLAGRALLRMHERFAYNCGAIDRVRSVRPNGIYFGRWFNVWAGALLCVVMFLLVSRMTRSQWAGLFAAGLVGFAQYSVEHSHYAETDIAAILTLAFAFWLWVVASDTVNVRWFIAASLASGFAAGTKFTLLVFAPIVLVEAVLFARQRFPSGWWKRMIGFVCLGFLLFVAGFAIANPAVLLDFKWFWAGLAAEKHRVYAETALNLGPLGITPTVRYLHHFWCLHDHLKTLGYPWLVLIAAGLPCVVLCLGGASLAELPGRHEPGSGTGGQAGEAWVGFPRRYWAVLFLFPLLYAAYWLFMAPWVRSQEFLLFLPSFAAIAVLPLVVLWRAKRFLYRAMALIFAVLAITANGYNGLRVSALFGWKDTRLMAREWLQTRLPLESALAAESYAEAACVDTWKSPLLINKIERYGIAPLVDQGAAYLMRTSGIGGRGLRNPLTGELYSAPAELFRQFLAESELLCAWAPLPPRGFATFVSPAIELYGLKRFTPATPLQITLPQPALIVNGDQNQVGRQTFFPVGHGLGCATALLVDRLPQTIAVGGPESLDKPVFLVLNTAERPAVINVHGFGMAKKVSLEPYDTCVVPLKRPEWQPRGKPYETITLKADPVKDVLYIPCFARLAFTVDEVVRIFLETAREDRLEKYVSEGLPEKDLGPDVKYMMATRLGLWPMADQTRKSAAAVQAALGKCIQADPASVSINGCSGYYYEQFARARLQQPYDFTCLFSSDRHNWQSLPDAMKVLDLQLPRDGEGSKPIVQFGPIGARHNVLASAQLGFGETRSQQQADEARKESGYYQRLTIPVLIGRGRYELRGELMLKLEGAETDSCVSLAVRTIKGQTDADCCLELQPGTWRNFSLVFQPWREMQPQIDFQSPVAAQLYLKNMEICWSLSDALESAQGDLAMAEIRHSIHQADWEKATAQLTALPEVNRAANELEIRQMMFTCADGLKGDPSQRPWPSSLAGTSPDRAQAGRQAADQLLELAPGHYMSLLALAAEDETAGKIARQMEGNLKNQFAFTPWLALVGFSFNAETKEARCVFEALRNETPGLAATFWLQRRGEWRQKQVQALTACPHLPAALCTALQAGRYAKRCRRAGALMSKGERVVIVVRLNDTFNQTLDLDKLALGIETDVLWHAGAIPLATGDYVIPFSRLCE